ncbi:MAG: DUF2892 domain-containing protein [Methylophaga sp.]|nr:DUF2892 domain-containing protein [Methylophaga sp.]
MQKNLGKWDSRIRIVLGSVIIAVALYYQSWWALLGVGLLINGLTQRCGGYALFGFSTAESCAIKGNGETELKK